MKKIFIIFILAAMSCQSVLAKSINDIDKMKVVEEKCSILQHKVTNAENNLTHIAATNHVTP